MRPGTSQGICPAVLGLPLRLLGSARCWSPRCCSCSGTIPIPVTITPFLFAPWVHPCLRHICPSPGVGRSLLGRVCARLFVPWCLLLHLGAQGEDGAVALVASLAMQGNSQFPRESLSPGQPCSPNIYISHYCLHTSLFSGGVSSFPLLPQCSPCSISFGAAIPNAVALHPLALD